MPEFDKIFANGKWLSNIGKLIITKQNNKIKKKIKKIMKQM